MKDFREHHIQDLSDLLERHYTHRQLSDILARFEAEHLEVGLGGGSKVDRIRNWLRNGDGTEKGRAVLAHLIENTRSDQEDIDMLDKALSGSRFFLYSEGGALKIGLRLTATAEVQVQTHRTFLEAHAPQGVLEEVGAAEQALFEGRWALVLHHCRRALEAATTGGNYSAALDELVAQGLISRWGGSGAKRTFDREMLYVPYGYCSTLGSHRQEESKQASSAQAELGLVLTEEVLHFILQMLEHAKQQGKQVNRWREEN